MPTFPEVTACLKQIGRSALARVGLLTPFRELKHEVFREVFNIRQNFLTPQGIAAIYAKQYHQLAHYGEVVANKDWESAEVIKLAHADAVLGVLPSVRKIVVGGCSSGMGVVAFRRRGLEAWGFDISADLNAMALDEAREFVRRGSMTDIPFGPEDRFDCLVTTDVLEHVHLRYVSKMISEMARLGTPWMAHLINHTDMTPDHMTLKPLVWWQKRMRAHYQLRPDLKAPCFTNPRIYGLNGDPLHVYTFWERTAASTPG